jgi:hypothetical protein
VGNVSISCVELVIVPAGNAVVGILPLRNIVPVSNVRVIGSQCITISRVVIRCRYILSSVTINIMTLSRQAALRVLRYEIWLSSFDLVMSVC